MRQKTCRIYTLGCKVNQTDSGELVNLFERAGFIMAKKKADVLRQPSAFFYL